MISFEKQVSIVEYSFLIFSFKLILKRFRPQPTRVVRWNIFEIDDARKSNTVYEMVCIHTFTKQIISNLFMWNGNHYILLQLRVETCWILLFERQFEKYAVAKSLLFWISTGKHLKWPKVKN